MPLVAKLLGAACHALGQVVRRCVHWLLAGFGPWFNFKISQFLENRLHRSIGVAEEEAPADAREDPAQAFEYSLTFHVFG